MKLIKETIQLNPVKILNIGQEHEIGNHKIIGIFGPSGCGKTSFLNYLYQQHTKNNAYSTAYMKQDIFLYPQLTIYETLWFYTILRCKKECANIENVLKQMKISHLSGCRIGETKGLSGGEKKRILIAYHLLDTISHYILMDEPFSGIDPSNIEMIFQLLKEKTLGGCSIIMTAHQLPFDVHHQFDEKWSFLVSPEDNHSFYLDITPEYQEDTFSDISLGSVLVSLENGHSRTNVFHQWRYLFIRDRMIDNRNRVGFVMRWATPLFVILMQQIFIGSFPQYLKLWNTSHNLIDLFKVIVMHTILLFTVSMTPMHMLNDHFQKRHIILHEISQGIYRRNAYLFSAILWDQLSLLIISLCIVLMLDPPDSLFFTTFFNIAMEMNFTNILMWFVSSFPRSSFNTTLILVSTYISIAFIGNMGMLLRHPYLKWIQYTSTTHMQSNLFMEKLFQLFPNSNDQLSFIISCLNIHSRMPYYIWILISLGQWVLFPFLILFFCFFYKK